MQRKPTQPTPARMPEACRLVMPFGRYAGESLRDIGRRDLRYLRWLASELHDDNLRDAAGEVLDWIGGRA